MRLLPIVPGCRALMAPTTAVNHHGARRPTPSHVVSVLYHTTNYANRYPCVRCGRDDRIWRIDTPLGDYGHHYYTCECRMTRIDGDPDATREQDRELTQA